VQSTAMSPTPYVAIDSANKTYHVSFIYDPNATKWIVLCRSYMA
jgi:hypothetical protein